MNVLTMRASEIPAREARKIWREFRVSEGFADGGPLLGTGNAKANKNALPTYTLSLFPVYMGVCPFSTPECRATCLQDTGRGGEPRVTAGRKLRNRFLAAHLDAFASLVKAELIAAVRKHGAVACRLNTLSDVPWELVAPWLLDIAGVTFYDYTKNWSRVSMPNYSLTHSASERTSPADIVAKVATGATVAVVFETKYRSGAAVQHPLPETYYGAPVIDGDKTDERFNDTGVVVGLRAKGKAAQLPVGGFVKAAQ
jgi:hypothetical protein